MNKECKDIYNRLHKIYKKHLKRYRNPDSKQICCMWSTFNPPDEIYECQQIYDIEEEFDIELTLDDALEIYDMMLEEASESILKIINKTK
ncbi:MAG: hypothetical protein MRK01_01805 [Candidatus Scalindua sp.]|nr:hypothetical protein [Candidatus Scalindua sp.]